MGIDLTYCDGSGGGIPRLKITEENGVFIEGTLLGGVVKYDISGTHRTTRLIIEIVVDGELKNGEELINPGVAKKIPQAHVAT